MPDKRDSIFRPKALERLSSPEKLDHLVEMVGSREWMALLALALLVCGALVWSIVGRLPTTVQGRGVLVRPGLVVEFQAPASGRLMVLNVRAGDRVENGDPLGTVEQTELRKQMQEEQVRLGQLQAQDREQGALLSQRRRLDARQVLEQTRFVRLQQENRANRVSDAEALTPARKHEIQATITRIAFLQVQLEKNGRIVSEHKGRVLELAANPGQFVSEGQRVGTLEVDDPGTQPTAIVYFPVKDGKRIQAGMKLQFTPDTVQRERFGGIVGAVIRVSPFPATKAGAASLIGDPELAESLLSAGPQIEVIADLERDSSVLSGYRWSSSKGPSMPITPGLTATARVEVERRAPISYVFPFLRSSVGIY